MPNRNKTGPEGQGPMTGWGFGNCNGNSAVDDRVQSPGRFGPGRGRGFGPGRGQGRGFGFGGNFGRRDVRGYGAGFGGGFSRTMTLVERKKYLEEELTAVNEQMKQQKPEKPEK